MENKADSRKERKQIKNKKSWRQKRKDKKEAFKKKRMARHPVVRYLFDIGRYTRRATMLSLLFVNLGILTGVYIYDNNYSEKVSSSIREGYEIAESIHPSDFEVLDPTVMTDSKGNIIKTFTERNFKHLDLHTDDELYQKVSDVTTTIEDARFYDHKGFDYLGVGVAAANHFIRGQDLRGASTLTAQLVKNTYLTPEQSIERKITEAVIAQELEKRFTKREILEFYVNDAYYANGNYGMETAAHYYFSRPTKELTHSEIATLISIPNNPTIYNPITNPDNTTARRNLILSLLGENGVLSQEIVAAEQEKELNLNITETRIDNEVYDWGQSLALFSAVEEMMRNEGFTFEYWFDTDEERSNYKELYNETYYRHLEDIRRGGFVIETSIDSDMQNKLQNTVDKQTAHYTKIDEDGYYSKQTPSVVIDNRTNEVVAIVGGRTQENMGTFNRAFQSARQPGSAIKPFLSFAPAIESGLATNTIRKDAQIEGGPRNWYRSHRGDMTLRYALEQSVNTIAYNLYQEVGMEYARGKLIDMEFRSLAPQDIYPTFGVGGWTYGASPLEIASAFNTLVNDGLYYRPNNLRKISSIHKDETYYDRSTHKPKRVYSSGAGFVTLNMMQTAITDGINGGYAFDYGFEAAKTGSTNEWREQWIVGGTPYYSMSIYIGDNNPAAQNQRESTRTLQNIFTGYMKDIHKGLEVVDFEKPKTVVQDGNNYWVRSENDVDPQDVRKREEQQRVNVVHQAQNQRLSNLSYRIKHGLSLNEAIAKEKIAEAQIRQLERVKLPPTGELAEAETVRESAKAALEQVVRPGEEQKLSARLTRAWNSVITQKNSIDNARRIEEERLEQEIIEQERLEKEEQERQERERQEREDEALNDSNENEENVPNISGEDEDNEDESDEDEATSNQEEVLPESD